MKDTIFCKKHTWNIRGELIDLSTPKIMGIVNCTPDSFFDSSRKQTEQDVLQTVKQMIAEQVDMIDVGGYSSRPGAKEVDEKEELKRVVPIIKAIRQAFPDIIISIDTFRASVAEQCLDLGADVVNDISGGRLDGNMLAVIKKYQCPYIAMHMRGTPQNMQEFATYNQVTMEVIQELSTLTYELRKNGIHDFAIDPGFGFSKSVEHNYTLLQDLKMFETLDCPILVGVSRKSMLCKPLQINTTDALNATTVANTIALLQGANILRVHDVKEAVQARQIVTFTQNPSETNT